LAGSIGKLIPGPEVYFTDFDHFEEAQELNEEAYPMEEEAEKLV